MRRLPHTYPPEALDEALRLKDSRIAIIVAGALERGEVEYRLYEKFAWAIVPFRHLPEVTCAIQTN